MVVDLVYFVSIMDQMLEQKILRNILAQQNLNPKFDEKIRQHPMKSTFLLDYNDEKYYFVRSIFIVLTNRRKFDTYDVGFATIRVVG